MPPLSPDIEGGLVPDDSVKSTNFKTSGYRFEGEAYGITDAFENLLATAEKFEAPLDHIANKDFFTIVDPSDKPDEETPSVGLIGLGTVVPFQLEGMTECVDNEAYKTQRDTIENLVQQLRVLSAGYQTNFLETPWMSDLELIDEARGYNIERLNPGLASVNSMLLHYSKIPDAVLPSIVYTKSEREHRANVWGLIMRWGVDSFIKQVETSTRESLKSHHYLPGGLLVQELLPVSDPGDTGPQAPLDLSRELTNIYLGNTIQNIVTTFNDLYLVPNDTSYSNKPRLDWEIKMLLWAYADVMTGNRVKRNIEVVDPYQGDSNGLGLIRGAYVWTGARFPSIVDNNEFDSVDAFAESGPDTLYPALVQYLIYFYYVKHVKAEEMKRRLVAWFTSQYAGWLTEWEANNTRKGIVLDVNQKINYDNAKEWVMFLAKKAAKSNALTFSGAISVKQRYEEMLFETLALQRVEDMNNPSLNAEGLRHFLEDEEHTEESLYYLLCRTPKFVEGLIDYVRSGKNKAKFIGSVLEDDYFQTIANFEDTTNFTIFLNTYFGGGDIDLQKAEEEFLNTNYANYIMIMVRLFRPVKVTGRVNVEQTYEANIRRFSQYRKMPSNIVKDADISLPSIFVMSGKVVTGGEQLQVFFETDIRNRALILLPTNMSSIESDILDNMKYDRFLGVNTGNKTAGYWIAESLQRELIVAKDSLQALERSYLVPQMEERDSIYPNGAHKSVVFNSKVTFSSSDFARASENLTYTWRWYFIPDADVGKDYGAQDTSSSGTVQPIEPNESFNVFFVNEQLVSGNLNQRQRQALFRNSNVQYLGRGRKVTLLENELVLTGSTILPAQQGSYVCFVTQGDPDSRTVFGGTIQSQFAHLKVNPWCRRCEIYYEQSEAGLPNACNWSMPLTQENADLVNIAAKLLGQKPIVITMFSANTGGPIKGGSVAVRDIQWLVNSRYKPSVTKPLISVETLLDIHNFLAFELKDYKGEHLDHLFKLALGSDYKTNSDSLLSESIYFDIAGDIEWHEYTSNAREALGDKPHWDNATLQNMVGGSIWIPNAYYDKLDVTKPTFGSFLAMKFVGRLVEGLVRRSGVVRDGSIDLINPKIPIQPNEYSPGNIFKIKEIYSVFKRILKEFSEDTVGLEAEFQEEFDRASVVGGQLLETHHRVTIELEFIDEQIVLFTEQLKEFKASITLFLDEASRRFIQADKNFKIDENEYLMLNPTRDTVVRALKKEIESLGKEADAQELELETLNSEKDLIEPTLEFQGPSRKAIEIEKLATIVDRIDAIAVRRNEMQNEIAVLNAALEIELLRLLGERTVEFNEAKRALDQLVAQQENGPEINQFEINLNGLGNSKEDLTVELSRVNNLLAKNNETIEENQQLRRAQIEERLAKFAPNYDYDTFVGEDLFSNIQAYNACIEEMFEKWQSSAVDVTTAAQIGENQLIDLTIYANNIQDIHDPLIVKQRNLLKHRAAFEYANSPFSTMRRRNEVLNCSDYEDQVVIAAQNVVVNSKDRLKLTSYHSFKSKWPSTTKVSSLQGIVAGAGFENWPTMFSKFEHHLQQRVQGIIASPGLGVNNETVLNIVMQAYALVELRNLMYNHGVPPLIFNEKGRVEEFIESFVQSIKPTFQPAIRVRGHEFRSGFRTLSLAAVGTAQYDIILDLVTLSRYIEWQKTGRTTEPVRKAVRPVIFQVDPNAAFRRRKFNPFDLRLRFEVGLSDVVRDELAAALRALNGEVDKFRRFVGNYTLVTENVEDIPEAGDASGFGFNFDLLLETFLNVTRAEFDALDPDDQQVVVNDIQQFLDESPNERYLGLVGKFPSETIRQYYNAATPVPFDIGEASMQANQAALAAVLEKVDNEAASIINLPTRLTEEELEWNLSELEYLAGANDLLDNLL